MSARLAVRRVGITSIIERTVLSASALFACWVLSKQILRYKHGLNTLDESYYAFHLHQFHELGMAGSFDRSIHQFTSMFLYPLVKLFWFVSGSQDGTILFLRWSYIAMVGIGAIVLVIAIRAMSLAGSKHQLPIAIVSATAYLGFVPFGVQAISYNTLPVFLIITVLATSTTNSTSSYLAVFLGLASSISILSSPQTSFVILFLLGYFARASWKELEFWKSRIVLMAITFVIPFVLILSVFGVAKFVDIYQFQSSYSSFEGLWFRLRPAFYLLSDDREFTLLILLTGAHRMIPRVRHSLLSPTIILLCVWMTLNKESHLIFISHELVLLVGSASFWRLISLTSWRRERQKSLFVAASVGLAVSFGIATQNNPLYNASVALVIAAVVSIHDCISYVSKWELAPRLVISAALLVVCTNASFDTVAAADSQDGYSWEVQTGWFQGIQTTPSYEDLQAGLLVVVNRHLAEDRRAAYFGDHFGFLLDVNFVSVNPQSYPLLRGNRYQNPTSERAIYATTTFFSDPDHLPSTVFVENGALIPIGFQFFCLYSMKSEEIIGVDLVVRVYQRDESIQICPA